MILHVLPVNDTLNHEEKSTCHCDPEIVLINGNIILVHQAYDGRVGVEIVNEILNGDLEEKQNIEKLIKKKKSQATDVNKSLEGILAEKILEVERPNHIKEVKQMPKEMLKDNNEILRDQLKSELDSDTREQF